MEDYIQQRRSKVFVTPHHVREVIDRILLSPSNRDKVIVFIEGLFSQLDEMLSFYGLRCDNCGRCCNFDSFDFELFVSSLEFVYFLCRLDDGSDVGGRFSGQRRKDKRISKALWNIKGSRICPYLDGRDCSVRKIRPIGCRIFFCCSPSRYDQGSLYEKILRRVKEFSRKEDIEYLYFPWLMGLEVYRTEKCIY